MTILHLDATQKRVIIAVSDADDRTRLTGLSSFTVYWSLNGSTPVAIAAPTVTELDAVNMPGVYAVSIDVAAMVTLASGDDFGELVITVSHAGMVSVDRAFDIKRFSEWDDEELDKTTDPASWRINRKRRGGATVVGTKILRDTDGNVVAATGVAIGSMKDS